MQKNEYQKRGRLAQIPKLKLFDLIASEVNERFGYLGVEIDQRNIQAFYYEKGETTKYAHYIAPVMAQALGFTLAEFYNPNIPFPSLSLDAMQDNLTPITITPEELGIKG